MLTPQEVSQHAFAKANFGGYNMAMVDEFLTSSPRTTPRSIKRTPPQEQDEGSGGQGGGVPRHRGRMRQALLAAQRIADEMVAEAEQKKEALMRTAEAEARAKIEGLRHELESEQLRLTAAQNATTAYVAKLKGLYQHEMEYLSTLSSLDGPEPTTADKAAREIESPCRRIKRRRPRTGGRARGHCGSLDLQADAPEPEKGGTAACMPSCWS